MIAGLSMGLMQSCSCRQAGTQADQFVSTIDRTGNITNFAENCAGKSFFFSEDSKETCPYIFLSAIIKLRS